MNNYSAATVDYIPWITSSYYNTSLTNCTIYTYPIYTYVSYSNYASSPKYNCLICQKQLKELMKE